MNMAAISRIIKLAQYLDKEAGQVLDKSLLAALEIMPQCINNYETNMSKALDELQIVDKKDFARIVELFFNIKIELSLYELDMKKLSYSWLRLLKDDFTENRISRQKEIVGVNNCGTDNHIDILFQRIGDAIIVFNIVNSEHIFHKKDLKALQDNSDEMCQALNNLNNFINEYFISKNDCEYLDDPISPMRWISYDINNVTYAIDFLLNILTKIVDFYNRKAC